MNIDFIFPVAQSICDGESASKIHDLTEYAIDRAVDEYCKAIRLNLRCCDANNLWLLLPKLENMVKLYESKRLNELVVARQKFLYAFIPLGWSGSM